MTKGGTFDKNIPTITREVFLCAEQLPWAPVEKYWILLGNLYEFILHHSSTLSRVNVERYFEDGFC